MQDGGANLPPVEPTDVPPPSAGSGLPPNVAAGIAALVPLVGGVIFWILDRQKPFVALHAMQSIYFGAACVLAGIALTVVPMVLGIIPFLRWLASLALSMLVSLGVPILWAVAVIKAFSGERWLMPVIGEMVETQLKSAG